MKTQANFTSGHIFSPLIRFTLPILAALVLQALYGAVDLLVVGQFTDPAISAQAVSAVSTGSQLMVTVTSIITGLSMGVTVLIAQAIGRADAKAAGDAVGGGIALFALVGVLLTAAILLLAQPLTRLIHAPESAFTQTVAYVRICGGGTMFIVAFNVLGSVFRGIGDARTPLLAVVIACIANIALDILFVAGFRMGAAGAAFATVLSQTISVMLSLLLIRRQGLPFPLERRQIRLTRRKFAAIFRMGGPCALQDLLVSISFLVILAIVNSLGLVASAGVGVAEKLCMFIMLIPSAYMQAISAFVAQNIGASRPDRAKKAMLVGMLTSVLVGIVLAYLAFFHGAALAHIFARDEQVIGAAADYLKAYAIDTLLVSFLFCFIGYFNGCGRTSFVMAQGVLGSFCVRIPVSFFMSQRADVSLFAIGLATPCSTAVQITLCVLYFLYLRRHEGMCSQTSTYPADD